jgi:hypothetical protein
MNTTRYKVTIRALSRGETGGVNHSFTIVKEVDRQDIRSCESDASGDAGGCTSGTW